MLSIDDKAQAFTAPPEQTNEQAKATAAYIARQIEEQEGRPLRVALASRLGSVVGSFLEHCIFWSGKSGHCENGWFYQNRDDVYEKSGCDRREQTLARKVLCGDREWKGKTFNLLQESRPSRRQAVHFRVDLLAVADLVDVILPDELLPEDLDDLDDFDLGDDLDDEAPESPYRATHKEGQDTPESPYRATESPNRATESPYRASESPNRAASALSSASPSSLSFSPSSLQDAANQKTDSPHEPKSNKDFSEPEEQRAPTQPDKRHSQDRDTQHKEQAPRDRVEKPKAPPLPDDANLLADLREVLNPDSGRWSVGAELVREKYDKKYDAYSPKTLARNLATEPDLPYAGRKDDLAQCLRYLFWEWSNEKQARQVAA